MRTIPDMIRHLPDDLLLSFERAARAERIRRDKRRAGMSDVVDIEDAAIERLRGVALEQFLAKMNPHEVGGTA